MKPIRVMIADDAVVVRRLLTMVINEDPELELVGVAQNGAIAVAKMELLKPDVITLDIEMPEMDGLQALAAIRKLNRDIPIIMFSTLTERGAAATLEALSLGASDYVTKPANVGSVGAAMDKVREDLIPRIKALCHRSDGGARGSTIRARRGTAGSEGVAGPAAVSAPMAFPPLTRKVVAATLTGKVDIVAIGSSTGGPVALSTVLEALPANLRVPVVITQHMPPVFTRLLGQRLDASVPMRVREAVDGDLLEPGLVLIAPGDYHMTLERGAGAAAPVKVRLNQREPVNFCRPAVDVMFNSVAAILGGNVLGVILTGMGHDGRDGCATLKERGARVIIQDEPTSVVWGMPGAVSQAGLADAQFPLDKIGKAIVDSVDGASRSARAAS
jgi:two-component system chemotaxis response regulator CheB